MTEQRTTADDGMRAILASMAEGVNELAAEFDLPAAPVDDVLAGFDRWLAEHDREVAAKAWDEGVGAVFKWWETPEDDRPLGIVNPHGAGLFPENTEAPS